MAASGTAQQSAIPIIGYLSTRSPAETKYVTDAFAQGLNEIGYMEGRNLAIEFRWAELQYDRLPALASDLVRRQVAVIAAVVIPSELLHVLQQVHNFLLANVPALTAHFAQSGLGRSVTKNQEAVTENQRATFYSITSSRAVLIRTWMLI